MKKLLIPLLALAATTSTASANGGATSAAATPFGTWTNPSRSLAVRIQSCGQQICGSIVAATREAESDARDSGVNELVGIQLLSDYHQSSARRWDGTVYVPDMGRRFSSHIVQTNQNVLRISGCLIGGMLCKSQDWTRI